LYLFRKPVLTAAAPAIFTSSDRFAATSSIKEEEGA